MKIRAQDNPTNISLSSENLKKEQTKKIQCVKGVVFHISIPKVWDSIPE